MTQAEYKDLRRLHRTLTRAVCVERPGTERYRTAEANLMAFNRLLGASYRFKFVRSLYHRGADAVYCPASRWKQAYRGRKLAEQCRPSRYRLFADSPLEVQPLP